MPYIEFTDIQKQRAAAVDLEAGGLRRNRAGGRTEALRPIATGCYNSRKKDRSLRQGRGLSFFRARGASW